MFRAPIAVLLFSATVLGGLAAPTPASAAAPPSILINELANGGPGSNSDSFFELRNWSDEAVDLTGWHVYRCSYQGLRSNVGRPESDLTGVVLQPGQIYTVSKTGMPGDAHVTQPFAETGFGLYLTGPDDRLADAVGVYPNTPWRTQSECTVGANLANRLDFAAGESWQRLSATGDTARDFIVAPSTLGEPNRTAEAPREQTGVEISEIASAGPASAADEFIELANTGATAQDIGGWQLYRCTATGRLTAGTLELTIADGTTLAPGERWVAGGADFTGKADERTVHAIADVTFGILVRSDAGRLVDRVSVSAHDDSACQEGDDKLPAVLDAVAGESYQRSGAGWLVAGRTPGAANATVADSVMAQTFAYRGGVAISEIATDPNPDGMPAGTVQRNYLELGNYGSEPVDIGGWTVRRCEADGMRSLTPQVTVPPGTTVAPGAVYLAARAGTAAASTADITYDTSLNFLGTGLWVEDASGTRVDSVGIFGANEMDSSNIVDSPCTLGIALTTYLPDRLLEETFQRTRFTGSNVDDFAVRPATPGTIDLIDWVDPTLRVVTSTTASLDPARRDRAVARTMPATPATVLEAWSGVTDGVALTTLSGPNETALDVAAPAPTTDDSYGFPYQRFVLDAHDLGAGSAVGWTGSTLPRDEVQLSVWNGTSWRLLQAGSGDPVELSGVLEAGDIRDGVVTLLAQDGPRGIPTLSGGMDGELENPDDYDFSIAHITDTQYLSESYPAVYAQLASWIADNAGPRKIEFTTHTGDIVQNWVDPDQNEIRARLEFGRASAVQAILDDAGVPNSVVAGNHDSKRGQDRSLFNEYFGPDRYAEADWYGGSIAPGDNSASFSTFEAPSSTGVGAKFLMLTLPYAYADREIAWAQQVITSHPEYNVVISTHEHVMAKTGEAPALRAVNSRWVSRAQVLWDTVIAPNRNVVLVLSGHFHGVGELVTENAGDIPGHTVVELVADYQEFRTHTGERATGFYRMLQVDLDAASIAVDTRSVRLAASYGYEYDYRQFLPDNGVVTTPSNARPWRIVEAGLQGRYGPVDDEFAAPVTFQHPKAVTTTGLTVSP